MTKKDIEKVIKQVPDLHIYGIGFVEELRGKNIGEEMKRLQKLLLEESKSCTYVCDWLADKKKLKNINLNIASSYGLKHRVEKEYNTYIPNGAFICAAIFCGFNYKRKLGGVKIFFNLSKRGLSCIY